MAEQLINSIVSNDIPACFFSKQMTFLESRDFIKNEVHLKSCLECQRKISDFENYRQDLLEYFDRFKATDEVYSQLSHELAEIIPTPVKDEIVGTPTLKKTNYSLSVKEFLIFLIFGIPRKVQFVLCAMIALAALIY